MRLAALQQHVLVFDSDCPVRLAPREVLVLDAPESPAARAFDLSASSCSGSCQSVFGSSVKA